MENSDQFEYTYDGVKIRKKTGHSCYECYFVNKTGEYCIVLNKVLSTECAKDKIVFEKIKP